MHRRLEQTPAWALTLAYVAALLATHSGALAAHLAISVAFLALALIRGRELGEILGALTFAWFGASLIHVSPPEKAAIMLIVPAALLYAVRRRVPAG